MSCRRNTLVFACTSLITSLESFKRTAQNSLFNWFLFGFFGVFYCLSCHMCQKCAEPDSSQTLVIKETRCYASTALKNSSFGLTLLLNIQEETTVGFFPVLRNAQMSLTPAPARKKVDDEHMGAVDVWFSALLPQNTTLLLKSSVILLRCEHSWWKM